MPSKRSALCTYPGCRAVTQPGDARCAQHPYPYGNARTGWKPDSVRGNAAQRGYGYAWVRRREWVLRRDNGLCQMCLSRGIMTRASEVDHIVPKCFGGGDNMENLQALCGECHSAKTAREAIEVAKRGSAPSVIKRPYLDEK